MVWRVNTCSGCGSMVLVASDTHNTANPNVGQGQCIMYLTIVCLCIICLLQMNDRQTQIE